MLRGLISLDLRKDPATVLWMQLRHELCDEEDQKKSPAALSTGRTSHSILANLAKTKWD